MKDFRETVMRSTSSSNLVAIADAGASRRRALAKLMAGCAMAAAPLLHAQPNSKDPDDATLRGDMSNGDRVFMRSAGGLLARDRQIGELGMKRFQKRELREWAGQLKNKSDALYRDITAFAERHKTNLPLDMSEESRRMVDRVAESKSAQFDRDMVRTVRALLEEQVRTFRKSAEDAEDKQVAALAQRASDERSELVKSLDRIAPRNAGGQ